MTVNSPPPLSPFKNHIHVLTLTPFYPTLRDDAAGCFISDSLPSIQNLGIHNTVIAVQPVYRTRDIGNPHVFPARHLRYPAIPGGPGLPAAGALLFTRLISAARELHETDPVHLIHAHGALPCGHAAALLGRELKIPFVVTVHGLDAYSTVQVRRSAGDWCKRISTFVYGAAACTICVSEKVRDRVLESPASKIRATVIYNGVDTKRFCPSLDSRDESHTILSVGDLIPTKGHELLLRSFAEVRKRFPYLSCDIIGDGPERSHLVSLAATLGIDSAVRFRGRRGRQEVQDAMRGCILFALPSRYEGLGCVYLEAMATAKAAVGCVGQGIEEVIEHGANGWLIPPDNQHELTDAVTELISNPTLRREMGDAARKTILQNFTVEVQAEHLAQIYREYAG